MTRLEKLNETVVAVDSGAKAVKLVKETLPHQAEEIDKGGLAEPGVRNCSLIAEFIIMYYLHDKKVDYGKRLTGKSDGKPIKPGQFDFGKSATGDPHVFYGGLGGHDIALIREGDLYALYQAWEGKYQVFPRLNDDDESHNIFGSGDETIELINNEVARLERVTKTGIDLKQMWP